MNQSNPESTSTNANPIISETKQATTPYKSKKTDNFVNKNKNVVTLDFESMSKEELIAQGKRLQSHVYQLKNLLRKSQEKNAKEFVSNNKSQPKDNKKELASAVTVEGVEERIENQLGSNEERKVKEKMQKARHDRNFDFSKFNKRHVNIKFAYLGWNYHGFTTQEGISNTVEHQMFEALIRTKLVESRETSNYHRCGRTDKGVSAFSQIISIDVRSNCTSGIGVTVSPESTVTNNDIKNEINYVKILNGALPHDIRVYCWAPIGNEMSARFDCTKRIYRYYFPKGDLDIDRMRDGGKRLVGEKDYRNFCKMDVSNGVVTFFRRINDISLNELDKEPNIYSTVELIVEGSSFLWHQIRCIVAVLFLIGQRKESPSIIDHLLDIKKYSSKPQYTISSEHPLVLFDCQYEGIDWVYDRGEIERVIKQLQDMWVHHQTQATIIKRMIDGLDTVLDDENVKRSEDDDKKQQFSNSRTMKQPYSILQGKHLSLTYVPLEERNKAKSLDDKVDHYVKRRRLDANVYGKINEANSIAQSLNIYKSAHNQMNEESKIKDE